LWEEAGWHLGDAERAPFSGPKGRRGDRSGGHGTGPAPPSCAGGRASL